MFTLSERRTWKVRNYALLPVLVCVSNEIVIRSQKVLRTAEHATNKSVLFIVFRNFCTLNLQVVSQSPALRKVRVLFGLLPISENRVILRGLLFINHK